MLVDSIGVSWKSLSDLQQWESIVKISDAWFNLCITGFYIHSHRPGKNSWAVSWDHVTLKTGLNDRGRVDVFTCHCMAVMIYCLKEVEMKLQWLILKVGGFLRRRTVERFWICCEFFQIVLEFLAAQYRLE